MQREAREHAHKAGEHAEKAVDHAEKTAQVQARHTAEKLTEKARATAEGTAHKIEGTAHKIGEQAREMTREGAAQMRAGVSHARESVATAAESARHKIEEVTERVRSDIAHGNLLSSFKAYVRSVRNLPTRTKAFIGLLATFNLLLPLLYIDKIEAQVTLGTGVASAIVMFLLSHFSGGYTRLLGAAHLPWIFLNYWLWQRKNVIDRGVPQLQAGAKPLSYEASDMWLFSWYLTILVGLNSIALVRDAWDVWRYYRGERAPRGRPMVSPVPGGAPMKQD
jgi:hypothetical protein